MAITITAERMKAIEAIGYGISGDIGGLPKTTYYTPDGRIIRAIPQIRGYVKKDAKDNVIESGNRDANLDRGWLLQMPQVKKPFCQPCDEWHDTLAEVKACQKKQAAMIARHQRKAVKSENRDKDRQIDELSRKVQALTDMVQKLAGAKEVG